MIAPLVMTEQLTSMTWQIVTTLLVGGAFLWLALALFRREPLLTFDPSAVAIEARYLKKVYGLPGPVKKAWQLGSEFAAHRRFRTRQDSSERGLVFALLLVGGLYLAFNLQGRLWALLFLYLSTAFAVRTVIEWRNALRPFDASTPPERVARRAAFDAALHAAGPWIMLVALSTNLTLLPLLADERPRMPVAAVVVLAALTLLVQLGRRTARLAAAKRASDRDGGGLVARVRGAWRQVVPRASSAPTCRAIRSGARDDELRREARNDRHLGAERRGQDDAAAHPRGRARSDGRRRPLQRPA